MPIDERYVPQTDFGSSARLLDLILQSNHHTSSYLRIIKHGEKYWIAASSMYCNDYLEGKVIDQGIWLTVEDVRDLITVLEYAISLEANDVGG